MSEIVTTSLKIAAKGTAIIFLSTVVSVVLWAITKLLIARNTTSEELGIYSLAIAIVSIIAVISDMGVQNGVTRYISILLGEGKRDEAASVAKASLQIGLFSGVVAWLLLFGGAGLIAEKVFYKPHIEYALRIISFYVPFVVISLIMAGILRGYGIMQGKVYFLDVGQPLIFLVFLAVCILLKAPFINMIYVYSLAIVAVLGGVMLYGYRKTGLSLFSRTRGLHHAELLRSSLPLMASSVMIIIFSWTDTLMLGRYADVQDVGVYNVGILLAGILTFPSIAMGYVFMPIAGELYGKNRQLELKRTYQVLTKWTFSLTFPAFFVLFLFPEMVISFLFGERFVLAALPLRILALGFLLQTFMGVSSLMMTVYDLSREILRVSIFGVVLNILLNYIFLKLLGYGIIGASMATMSSYLVINLLNSVLLYRKNGIHPFTPSYIKPLVGTIAAGILIYFIAKGLPFSMWLMPLYLVLFMSCYSISFLISGSIDSEDLFMIDLFSEKTGIDVGMLKKIVGRFNHRAVRNTPGE